MPLSHTRLKIIITLTIVIMALRPMVTNALWLQPGDLVFIASPCGDFCQAISDSTKTKTSTPFNHVAMVISSPSHHPATLIEATTHGVRTVPLTRYTHDHHDSPIIIGRLKPHFQALIPTAIHYSKEQIHKPYNTTFDDTSGSSFYCSQLIERSFFIAHHHHRVFQTIPMNFNDPHTHQPYSYWVTYFTKYHHAIPQGQPGTNPTAMAHDPALAWIKPFSQFQSL